LNAGAKVGCFSETTKSFLYFFCFWSFFCKKLTFVMFVNAFYVFCHGFATLFRKKLRKFAPKIKTNIETSYIYIIHYSKFSQKELV